MSLGKRWTRDELLVTLNLYHKLNFGQFHGRQPVIMAVAKKMGRAPNSLAMKLSNFASLDPALQLRGIRGLKGASGLDRSVWAEFHENIDESVPSSEEFFRKLFSVGPHNNIEVLPNKGIMLIKKSSNGITETTAKVKLRRGQDYFRNAVLNNFGGRCGVTGLSIRELLVASHILP